MGPWWNSALLVHSRFKSHGPSCHGDVFKRIQGLQFVPMLPTVKDDGECSPVVSKSSTLFHCSTTTATQTTTSSSGTLRLYCHFPGRPCCTAQIYAELNRPPQVVKLIITRTCRSCATSPDDGRISPCVCDHVHTMNLTFRCFDRMLTTFHHTHATVK